MAATLANGGVCPLSDELCIHPRPCRDVLSLMYSCGMYDYSGKFAFSVGLPAKSGVSGAMIVVVPNLMGICLFAPPLDKMGNSTKGVVFCRKLIQSFNFHNYDSLLHADTKKFDPRRRIGNRDTELVVSLLFAAQYGDFEAVRRLFMQGTNMEMADYDGRTALHIAAAEGHAHLVKFFLHVAKVHHNPKDRWGRVPIEDARQFKHDECIRLLLRAQMRDGRQYPTIEESSAVNGNHQNGKHVDGDESSSGDELSNGIGVMMIDDKELDTLPQRKGSSRRGNTLMLNGHALDSIKEVTPVSPSTPSNLSAPPFPKTIAADRNENP
ncbi:unnamed protein product, partial [Mesorhabditis belari]|uniref:glutaminase n=1 Tax=Mesorhabditis belari TaxID=2138241 RepID=A0AAF3J6N8_9BILA